jgi:hypothetical protein
MSNHPFFTGRQARRAARQETHSKVGEALRREAGGAWDLSRKLHGTSRPKTLPECITAAIGITRDLLAEFDFPSPPQLSYTGVKEVKTANNERNSPVEDGVLMLVARFQTVSGVRNEIQIPVQIRQGSILQPSVFLHNGTMSVIAPSSVKEILASGTFKQTYPAREMFSGPISPQDQQHWYDSTQNSKMDHSRFSPGMFGRTSQNNQQLLRAAVRGQATFEKAVTAQLDYSSGQTWVCPQCSRPSAVAGPMGWRKCPCGWTENLPMDLQESDSPRQSEMAPTTPVAPVVTARIAQLGVQPGRGDIKMKASPATTVGNRVESVITFDTDQTAQMSDGNLRQAIRSFVLELGSKKEWRDWGTVADIQVDDIDRKNGEATVSFKSSEIAAPQYAAPTIKDASRKLADGEKWRCTNQNCPEYLKDGSKEEACKACDQPMTGSITPRKTEFDKDANWLRRASKIAQEEMEMVCPGCGKRSPVNQQHPMFENWKQKGLKYFCFQCGKNQKCRIEPKIAAVGPSQSDSSLQPAERDKSENLHTGDWVKLDKEKVVRSRGGGMTTLPKGTKGEIVADVFGDGLHLKVKFDDAAEVITIPRTHLRKDSSGRTAQGRTDVKCSGCQKVMSSEEVESAEGNEEGKKCRECSSQHHEASVVQNPKQMIQKIVGEIKGLRETGYAPIDCILTARQRYGELGIQALKVAKVEGLLDSEVKRS